MSVSQEKTETSKSATDIDVGHKTLATKPIFYASVDPHDDNEPVVKKDVMGIVCTFPRWGTRVDRVIMAEKIAKALNDLNTNYH